MGDDFDDGGDYGDSGSSDFSSLDDAAASGFDFEAAASDLGLDLDVGGLGDLEDLADAFTTEDVLGATLVTDEASPGDSDDASDSSEGTDDLDAALTEEQFEAMSSQALSSYSPQLVEDIACTYDPLPDPIHPEYLGEYTVGTGEICLQDHAADALETLHHEIGHHITISHPSFGVNLASTLEREGWVAAHSGFLSQYDRTEHAAEACAEAFAHYSSNSEAFIDAYPESASLIESTRTA